MRKMVFGDYFGRSLNERGYPRRSSNQISISRDEYNTLKAMAEKYELLAEEHKRVRTRNDELLKELDNMKEDGRKLKELKEENEKYLNSLLRTRAEFENYKKRSERDNERYRAYAMEGILKKLVNHYDDLVRALNLLEILEKAEGIKEGFEIIVKNFKKILSEEGIEPMNTEGEKFDPYKHEVILVEEERDDLPENTILEELEKGYYFNNKVLRPAKVKISKRSKLQNLEENKVKIKIENKN